MHDCGGVNATLADFTPVYARLVGLPRLLGELYADSVRRLALVMLLREPLSRMRSGFLYSARVDSAELPWRNGDQVRTIATYAQLLEDTLPSTYDGVCANATALSTNPDLDSWYRSMYGLSMDPWITKPTFSPRQIVILPMRWTMSNVRTSVALLAARFPHMRIDSSRVPTSPPSENVGHALPGDDSMSMSAETERWLHESYFRPDVARFASALAHPVCNGLTVGGLSAEDAGCTDGTFAVAQRVSQHLWNAW